MQLCLVSLIIFLRSKSPEDPGPIMEKGETTEMEKTTEETIEGMTVEEMIEETTTGEMTRKDNPESLEIIKSQESIENLEKIVKEDLEEKKVTTEPPREKMVAGNSPTKRKEDLEEKEKAKGSLLKEPLEEKEVTELEPPVTIERRCNGQRLVP